MRSPTQTMLLRLAAWRRRVVPVHITIMVVASVVGIAAGVAAWMLKTGVKLLADTVTQWGRDDATMWYLIALPFAGIFMAVAYQRWVVHSNIEHGTEIVGRALAADNYRLRTRMCYDPIVASILTLGFGGSAGAEGPVATVGSALGSNIARWLGLPPQAMRILIGCGAGAGIAGIFKSPVGGALYTLEVMKLKLDSAQVLALIVASVFGALTCYALTGFTFDIQFLPQSFFDPAHIGWLAMLGLFCGLYSIYYLHVAKMLRRWFATFKNRWGLASVGAALLGVSIVTFPSLYGEGYGVVTQMVNGHIDSFMARGVFASIHVTPLSLLLMALGVMALKAFAAIATNSAGGVAGDFAPTIFAGAFCGLAFATGANWAFDAHLPVALFVLYGTAGAFAGIIHAPLMAVFLVAEMVGSGYGYIMPLFIVAIISNLTVRACKVAGLKL